MNRPKDIGTRAETAVVRYLQAHGWPSAERRALRGVGDAGDITGTPGICWQVKAGEAAERAGDRRVTQWLQATVRAEVHAGADLSVLVLKRAGAGLGSAGRWWAVMYGYQFECLTSPTGRWHTGTRFPVRMLLADAVTLLRIRGYGQPFDATDQTGQAVR